MIRPFNPLTYARHVFASDEARTNVIFELLGRDEFCAAILRDLKTYGYEISYPLFGPSGVYHSCLIKGEEGADFKAAFMQRHVRGDFKARFELSPRYGLGQNAFYFIHELIHFDQDLKGHLYSRDMLVNECEAAVQSIMAAHRLGGVVWEGALSSLDWGTLARIYGRDQDEEALQQLWQQSAQKRHYARRNIQASEGVSPVHLWKGLQV
ncbi:MAG: hypothetical protein KDJ35_04005 [Alphaproteobacteria bacterium]|nr:hypothetical protein [Alphaproteobacteria bacterium]